MRQVPSEALNPDYTIIGNGRLATHFVHYLTLLNIPFRQWSRKQDPKFLQLVDLLSTAKRICVMLSDEAIVPFVKKYCQQSNATIMHFSGCLTIEGVTGVHPLKSFTPSLYTLEEYEKIPLMIDNPNLDLHECLPGLPNPKHIIPANDKALYHALCVMAGNYTTMLWQKYFAECEQRWNIPNKSLQPYFEGVMQQLLQDPANALTGPLSRGDMHTVASNQQALDGDPFQQVYTAFVRAYQECQESHDAKVK